jgi:heme-degrading monooxygenase HmoA
MSESGLQFIILVYSAPKKWLLINRRNAMAVMVISKRVFRIEQRDKLIPLLQQLRNNAKKQKGFISRATYSSMNDPGEYIVISEWETVSSWRKWMDKKKTWEIQGKIDSLIGEKTVFDVYKPEKY